MDRRTPTQKTADALDLKMFNLASDLERLAKQTGDENIDELSRQVFGMRTRLRRHMNEADKKLSEEARLTYPTVNS